MCLIIHQPSGHTLSRRDFTDIAERNPDGFGIMTAHDGVLKTFRTLGSIDDAFALYVRHASGRASVLHWRYATHGTVTLDNVHPFKLTNDIAFVHNGMLSCGTPQSAQSDTAHLARTVLAPIARDNPRALFTSELRAVLSPLIGTGNKLAVMDNHGNVSIFNRASGMDHKGRWYSNAYAWNAPTRVVSPYHRGALLSSAWTVAPYDPMDAWDTMDADTPQTLAHAARDGERAVAEWVEDNQEEATELVVEHYGMTYDDVARIDTHTLAGWVHHITTGDVPASFLR